MPKVDLSAFLSPGCPSKRRTTTRGSSTCRHPMILDCPRPFRSLHVPPAHRWPRRRLSTAHRRLPRRRVLNVFGLWSVVARLPSLSVILPPQCERILLLFYTHTKYFCMISIQGRIFFFFSYLFSFTFSNIFFPSFLNTPFRKENNNFFFNHGT